MSSNDRENTSTGVEGEERMSEQLVALLRDRVATRYYDQPQVIDAVARAMLRNPERDQRA